MDRPQHSDLVRALKELSWSDVKQMTIHLDKLDLALLTDIEERPVKERVLYTMKAWLDRDGEASWAKVVSALRVIGKDVLAKKIDEERLITVPSPVTLHGQTESGPPVVSPVELQPSPGPDSLHQLQHENEATVFSTQLEPAFDHSASVSQESESDRTRAQETTEQETSDSDCPTVTQRDSEISGWRRERRKMVSNVAIMAAIVGAALAAAESGDDVILLSLTGTGSFAALVAFGVKLFIAEGVPTVLSKLAVFAAVAAVVVAVLLEAGTARTTAITIARTAVTSSRAIASVVAQYRSAIQLAAGGTNALIAAGYAVVTTEAVLPVLVTVAVAAVTIWAGTGVMVAAAVVSVTAGVMAVAEAGAATARGPSQAAAAQAAAAAVPVVVVVTAFRAAVLKSAAGLAAVVAVAAAAVAVAAAAVAVGSFPAVRLAAAAVTVGTVVVAEAAAIVTAILAPLVVGPPSAAAAVAAVIAVIALELASKLHSYLF